MAGNLGRKSVSFGSFSPSSKYSSRVKRANRKKGSRHEVLIRREIRRLGLSFRTNVETLPGVPDIVFGAAKVAVFCDGDFWHGRNWRQLRRALLHRHNADYWVAKIKSNRARDRRVSRRLQKDGWLVIRIWESDILAGPMASAASIRIILNQRH